MAEAQLRTLRSLLGRQAANLDRKDTIECEHFFSGAAAYANGRIFMTLTTVGSCTEATQRLQGACDRKRGHTAALFPERSDKERLRGGSESACQ
jgi:hypothetical protein